MRPWIATQLAASALRALLHKIAKYALLHIVSRSERSKIYQSSSLTTFPGFRLFYSPLAFLCKVRGNGEKEKNIKKEIEVKCRGENELQVGEGCPLSCRAPQHELR